MSGRSLRRVASSFASRQFLLFLLTGGCAAAVNFGSRILLNRAMPFSWAVVVAYLIGMVVAFVLAKVFVFKESRHAAHRAAGWFVAVNMVSAALTWSVSMLCLYLLLPALGIVHHAREIAHGVGVLAPVFTSYLGHKHFSFR